MMNKTVIGCGVIVAACAAFAACDGAASATSAQPAPATSKQSPSTAVERGKYLVSIVGCGDCHTPKTMGPSGPQPDMSRALAGHPERSKLPSTGGSQAWPIAVTGDLTAWSGPWGESFAANLTPDQNTGLGVWTEDMFVRAMRTGKHMGTSRPILPPMPWQDFAHMSDADLKAIYAYLRTVKPIVNHVPDPVAPARPTSRKHGVNCGTRDPVSTPLISWARSRRWALSAWIDVISASQQRR